MSKDRKVRNFDFLKQTPPPLPSREEVIQKTAELTGQPLVGEGLTPSVSVPFEAISAPVLVVTEPVITTPISTPVSAQIAPVIVIAEKVVEVPAKVSTEIVVVATPAVEKEKKTVQKKVKTIETPSVPIVAAHIEKSKAGRKALIDTRKPFTTTITVDNKKRLRQLCAEYDIAMSDVINEILAAHFDQRSPKF
ncbi:MAG: hypothetical protein U5L45_00755 [Saprospiraceae bacterium]|nr:hypothetical protein [Saprospiraceae bacterium]